MSIIKGLAVNVAGWVRGLATTLKAFFLMPFCMASVRAWRRSDDRTVDEVVEYCFDSSFGIIRPMQIPEELTGLLHEIRGREPQRVLEIGTARGGTLFCFANLVSDDAELVSVDLPGGRFGGGYPAWKKRLYRSFVGPEQTLHLVRADSHRDETLQLIDGLLDGRGLDFLFIDGDHTYEGVKEDFTMYSPLVSDGGLIALHDIVPHPPKTGCEVDRLWSELEAAYETRRFVRDAKQGWAGIGVVYV